MPLYLLNTNVLSRLARGADKSIAEQVGRNIDNCVVSAIVWYEMEYGAARSQDPQKSATRLTLLRAIFPIVHRFGEEEAAHAAAVRAYLETLEPAPLPIGPIDVLLAGHALAFNATLITYNTREFTRVPRLMVEDWQEPGKASATPS